MYPLQTVNAAKNKIFNKFASSRNQSGKGTGNRREEYLCMLNEYVGYG